MLSEKQRVLRWFYRQDFPDGQLEFDELLLEAGSKALLKDQLAAEAWATRNRSKYWNDVLAVTEEDRRRGRTPLFEVVSTGTRRVVWTPFSLIQSNERKVQRFGQRIRARSHILRTIDLFSSREYEALGCAISQLIGAKEIHLTPSGNEAGVDFFALLRLRGRSHIFGTTGAEFRIVGQSKLYDRPAAVDKMKEFTATLDSIRHANPTVMKHTPNWFVRSSVPIVGWFIAHNGVQSGAATKAREQGIIVSDSLDLAEVAAGSRDIPEAGPASIRCSTFAGLVQAALRSHVSGLAA
jgi:hypothetical protein